MKKVISLLLVLISLISTIPMNVFAANTAEPTEVIWLEDGSRIEISIETSPARVANTVSGAKTFTCYNSNDEALWVARLEATFAYSGAYYICSYADCNITINNSSWSNTRNDVVRSTNNAFAHITMIRKNLGITMETVNRTIQLTCNNQGQLS